MQNRKFESDFVFLETFITELNELTLVKLDFFRVVFLTEEGGGLMSHPSYFKKNLSNMSITLYKC